MQNLIEQLYKFRDRLMLGEYRFPNWGGEYQNGISDALEMAEEDLRTILTTYELEKRNG